MLTSVGVALPSLGRDLGTSATQLGLVEQIYMVSLAMFMLTFGRLGDIYGQRIMFLSGLIAFTLFTFLTGFAPTTKSVILLRFLQGFGASMVLSGSMALVAAAYPPEMRARKIGIVSACTYTGLSTGPVIGGFVTLHFGWRYVFLMSVPVGVIAIISCLFYIDDSTKEGIKEPMDWRGAFLYAASIGCIMTGASHLQQGTGGFLTLAGILGLVLFLYVERVSQSPLIEIKLLTDNRFFTLSSLAAMGNYAATFGIVFFMSLFLQYAKGLSARDAGFILLLQPIMQVFTSLLAGRLADKFETARIATCGMLISSAGLLMAALTISPAMPLWLIGLELMCIGAGFGIFITPNTTAIMGSVERRQFGLASGMIGAMRTLGMATSLTTITVIFSIYLGQQIITHSTLADFVASMKTGLILFSIYSSLGIILSISRGKQMMPGQKSA